jgi:hypothetical protein
VFSEWNIRWVTIKCYFQKENIEITKLSAEVSLTGRMTKANDLRKMIASDIQDQ